MNSDKSATRSALVGRYLTGLDLKMSCQALSANVRWTKTNLIGPRAVYNQLGSAVRDTINKASFNFSPSQWNRYHLDFGRVGWLVASVRQAGGPTNFKPILLG